MINFDHVSHYWILTANCTSTFFGNAPTYIVTFGTLYIFYPLPRGFVFVFFFRLEKEYTRVKHKEAEDNEELRRLKTENRLLLQRIDELEKVSG